MLVVRAIWLCTIFVMVGTMTMGVDIDTDAVILKLNKYWCTFFSFLERSPSRSDAEIQWSAADLLCSGVHHISLQLVQSFDDCFPTHNLSQ